MGGLRAERLYRRSGIARGLITASMRPPAKSLNRPTPVEGARGYEMLKQWSYLIRHRIC